MVITSSKKAETGSDNDSISLTSTIKSAHSENEFFEVKKILAENPESKKETFLIQWEGYPISRATWEPRRQIRHLRPIINEWRERQKLEESGTKEPFDTVAWAAAREESEDERQFRKIRRATKRKRLQRAANPEFDWEMRLRSKPNKTENTQDLTIGKGTSEDFIKYEPEVKEKLETKPKLLRKHKNHRAMRKIISDDDDEEINLKPEEGFTDSNLDIPQSSSVPSFQTHRNSLELTIEKHIFSPSSPDSPESRIFVQAQDRSSSSSDESLAQIIRRTRALKTASLSKNKELTCLSRKTRPPITGRSSSLSSSGDCPLAERVLRSSQKSGQKSNSIISPRKTSANQSVISSVNQRSPVIRENQTSVGNKHSSDSPQNILPLEKKMLRRRLVRKNSSPLKTTSDNKKLGEPSEDSITKVQLEEHQSGSSSENPSVSISEDLCNPSNLSQFEKIGSSTLSDKTSNMNTQVKQLCPQENLSESNLGTGNKHQTNSKKSVTPYQVQSTAFCVDNELVSSCLNEQLKVSVPSNPTNKNQSNNYFNHNDNLMDQASDSSEMNVSKSPTRSSFQNSRSENNSAQNPNLKCLQVHVVDSKISQIEKFSLDTNGPTSTLPDVFSKSKGQNHKSYSSSGAINSEFKLHDKQNLCKTVASSFSGNSEIELPGTKNPSESIPIGKNSTVVLPNKLNLERESQLIPQTLESPFLLQSSSSLPALSPVHLKITEKDSFEEKIFSKTRSETVVSGEACTSKETGSCHHSQKSLRSYQMNIESRTHHEDLRQESNSPKNSGEKRGSYTQSLLDTHDSNDSICRFYRRIGGCKRSSCPFRHPPDLQNHIVPSKEKKKKKKEPKMKSKMKMKSKSKTICKYWLANNCSFGTSCRNIHDQSPRASPTPKISNQDFSDKELEFNITSVKTSQEDKSMRNSYDASGESENGASPEQNLNAEIETPTINTAIHNHIEELNFIDNTEELSPCATTVQFISGATNSQVHDEIHGRPHLTLDSHAVLETSSIPVYGTENHNTNVESEKNKVLDLNVSTKRVKIGTDSSTSIALDFGSFEKAPNNTWKQSFYSCSVIHFNQLCIAQDFQLLSGLIKSPVIWQEYLGTVDVSDQDATKKIETVFNELVIRCAGLIATIDTFVILMFPVKREEWRFLDQSPEGSLDFRLRYSIFSNDVYCRQQDISSICTKIISNHQLSFYNTQNVFIMDLLQYFAPEIKDYASRSEFFLLFPPAASEIADFVKLCLIFHNPNFKIYGSMTEGSWGMFTRNQFSTPSDDSAKEISQRIVLIHEMAITELCRIPNLSTILNNTEAIFWQVSDGSLRYSPYPSRYFASSLRLGQISATKLFPHGSAVLLTPSFLISEPRAALEFIKWFNVEKFQKQVPLWRLVGAHNLSSYVLDVANSKACEAASYEKRHAKDFRKNSVMKDRCLDYTTCNMRWDLYAELFKISRCSTDGLGSGEDLESCLIQAPSFINPDNEHELIRWFAAWSAMSSDLFRKFVVIGTTSSNSSHAKYLKDVSQNKVDVPPLTKTTGLQNLEQKFSESKTQQNRRLDEKQNSRLHLRTQSTETLASDGAIEKDFTFSNKIIPLTTKRPRSRLDLASFNQIHERERSADINQDSTNKYLYSRIKDDDYDSQKLTTELKEQQFEATTEWYKRLKTRGSGWEHITVTEHQEAWQILGFSCPW